MASDECADLVTHLEWSDEPLDAALLAALQRANSDALLSSEARIQSATPAAHESWLARFIAASDNLPFCVSLSDSGSADFGLCFVNREFERITGYTRSEAVGRQVRRDRSAPRHNTCVRV